MEMYKHHSTFSLSLSLRVKSETSFLFVRFLSLEPWTIVSPHSRLSNVRTAVFIRFERTCTRRFQFPVSPGTLVKLAEHSSRHVRAHRVANLPEKSGYRFSSNECVSPYRNLDEIFIFVIPTGNLQFDPTVSSLVDRWPSFYLRSVTFLLNPCRIIDPSVRYSHRIDSRSTCSHASVIRSCVGFCENSSFVFVSFLS